MNRRARSAGTTDNAVQGYAGWYDLFSRGARDWLRHNEKIREANDRLQFLHGTPDVERVAIAGIAVGDDRDAHRLDDISLDGELFAGIDEAGVGDAFHRGRNGKAAGPDAVEACALDQPCAQGIVGTDNFYGPGFL